MIDNPYYDEPQITTSLIDKLFWDYFEGAANMSNNITNIASNITNITNIVSTTSAPTNITSVIRDQSPVLFTYAVLLAVGGVANVAVLATLTRCRRRKSRVDLLMTHLALADVCVTCGVIPLEIGWKYTNAWLAGNCMCKLLLVMRAFGLYLSSNVLVCISLDRFFAVIYPLRVTVARRRSKQMLWGAWAVALACSLPQSYVFSVKTHPGLSTFEQCVSFDAFSSANRMVAYNIFCLCAMYFFPLIMITVCYVCIFCKIHRNSKELDGKYEQRSNIGNVRLRRSDCRALERARKRTLRMTVTIVSVFALCWLPYATITMWYMIDPQSAQNVSYRVQDLLFVMAVSNSCMNPLVYGSYTLDFKSMIRGVLKNCCHSSSESDIIGTSGSSSGKNRNLDTNPMSVKTCRVRTRLGVRFAETSLTAVPDRLDVPKVPRGPA